MRQPLKRFTQCGSLTIFFVLFIILFGVSSSALTTFGKSNTNQNAPAATPTPAKAKECNTHDDCRTLQNTSCTKAPYDDKLRCLCGDGKPPINGYCSASKKGLRHMCFSDQQCEMGMMCAMDNATKPMMGGGSKNNIPSGGGNNLKVCLCNEDDGYYEVKVDNICNGASIVTGSLTTFVTVASILVSYKKMFN